ncbi:hypothetical protein [Nostoc sp.]
MNYPNLAPPEIGVFTSPKSILNTSCERDRLKLLQGKMQEYL